MISKEDFKKYRLKNIISQGETRAKGNRLFDFSLNENKILLKFSRKNHQEIVLPKIRKKLKKEFLLLQNAIDEKKIPVMVSLNSKNISIIYDETLIENKKKLKNLKENRVLGVDLNPNFIGVSVIEFNKDNTFKILHKELIELKELTKKSCLSSSDKYTKHLNNKREYENYKICYKLLNLLEYFKCKKFAIENLQFKGKNLKFKSLNRLCKNV